MAYKTVEFTHLMAVFSYYACTSDYSIISVNYRTWQGVVGICEFQFKSVHFGLSFLKEAQQNLSPIWECPFRGVKTQLGAIG